MADKDPRKVTLELLGGFDVAGPDGNRIQLTGRKSKALLAILALSSDMSENRERLAGVLWSDRGNEQARGSLHQVLASLKRELGQANVILEIERNRVGLLADHLTVDAVELQKLARNGRVRDASSLCKGQLLKGISVHDQLFEDWLSRQRRRLNDLAIELHDAWAAEAPERERIAAAQRLLDLDPLREASHRILMRAYAAQGRAAAALKQFKTCRDILRRELDVEPESETVALYREICRQRMETAEERIETLLEETVKEPPLPNGPSVAVLPFENKSDELDQTYFADALTENIVGGLTRFREILVIGVKSMLVARDYGTDLRELGRVLGVAHIVDGSVRRSGDRVRVSTQLVEAATGRRLWAETYDRDLGDIFAVQDEITNVIVATLAGQIERQELRRVVTRPEEDLGAYDYVLRGRQCLKRYSQDGEHEARRHFERALERKPDYAEALAGLAVSYLHEYEASWCTAPEAALEHCYELARKAVALDDTNGLALFAMASAHFYRGQHELAKLQIQRTLDLNPNDYRQICSLGWILAFSDRPADAVECSIRGLRLNPLTPDNCLFNIGMAEYVGERYEDALASFGKMKGWGLLRPAWIAACYAQLGRDEQARAAAAEVRALAPTDPTLPEEQDIVRWRDYWLRLIGFEVPDDQERFFDGLRKAGLPA